MKYLLLTILVSLTSSINAQQIKVDDALLLDYYQTQRFDDAVNYLKKAFPEPVGDPKVLSSLAYSLQMSNKLVEAESYYQRFYDLDTTNQSALLSMANINMRRGNYSKAEVFYKSGLTKDTTNFVVYKQLAFIAANKQDTLHAINYLQNANRINPYEPETASELSGFYIQQKHFDQALKLLNKVADHDPDDIIILMSLMRLTYGEKNWQQCVMYCNKLMQISINNGDHPINEALNKLGIAYYNLKNYSCAVETFAGIDGIAQTEYSYYYAALAYKGLKDYRQAVSFMNKAIAQGISPNIANYYGEIAENDEQLEKNTKAVQAYVKGLQFNEDPTIYYLLANLYDTKLKDKKSAVKYYKKFLALNKDTKKEAYIMYAQSRVDALKN